jgi:outer membrane protein
LTDVLRAAVWAFVPLAASGADLDARDASSAASEQIDARRFGYVHEKLHDWNVTLGGGAIFLPEYEGSDEFKVLPFPVFSASFRHTVHIDPTDVTIHLYEGDGFRAGVALTLNLRHDALDVISCL